MGNMVTMIKWVARDLRGGFRGLRIFLACLILGISLIAALGSLSASLHQGLQEEGRTILGGDFEFRLANRPATNAERAFINRYGTVTEIMSLRAMVHTPDEVAMAEIKAVDHLYPLYGEVSPLPPISVDAGIIVDEILLARLGLAIGDKLRIGTQSYRIQGQIEKEDDRLSMGFSFAPRILMAAASLPQSGLVQAGSLINYHYRLRLDEPAKAEELIKAAQRDFGESGWRIRGYEEGAASTRRGIERITIFLTLIGLSTLMIGGVGVGHAVSAYLRVRRDSIAIYKSLGATARQSVILYLGQIMVLSLIAILIGALIGIATPYAIDSLAGALIPVPIAPAIYPPPLLTAAGFGLFTSLAFSLWPLGKIHLITAACLFRSQESQAAAFPKVFYRLMVAACFAMLVAIAFFISPRIDIVLWFAGGMGLSFLALQLSIKLLKYGAHYMRDYSSSFSMRLAFSNLIRPQSPLQAMILSIGLSVSLLAAIILIDRNLEVQLQNGLPERAPSFFLVDIAPNQIDEFEAMVRQESDVVNLQKTPMLRGRIIALNGALVVNMKNIPEEAWILRGDRYITYSATPAAGDKIIAGTWWAEDYQGPPLVSLDVESARALSLKLGDSIRVNVLGRDMEAKIVNLRAIDWGSGGINFALVFSPVPLQSAPHSYLASLNLADTKSDAREIALQKKIATAYPNITIIRVKETVEMARRIIDRFALAIRILSIISLCAGVLVLAGALASSHRLRVYDAVMMKVVGATRRHILSVVLREYIIIGIVVALIAALTAHFIAWAVVTNILQADYILFASELFAIIMATISTTMLLGLIGTWHVLRAPTAATLRQL